MARLFEDEVLRSPWRIELMALRAFYRLQSLFVVNNFRSMASVTFLRLRFYASHHIHLFPDVRSVGVEWKRMIFNAWSELSVLYLPSLWSIMERIKDARYPFLSLTIWTHHSHTTIFTQWNPYLTRNHIRWLVWANVGLWVHRGISSSLAVFSFIF